MNTYILHTFDFTGAQRAELGRFNITHVLADIGKFKTPTLRNIYLQRG
jgi:cytochrome c peroxidase